MASFDEIRTELLAFRDAREWGQFHTLKNLAMSLCVESGELAELMQWKSEAEIATALKDDPAFRERVAHELADIQVLLMFAAQAAGIELDAAVRTKMALNATRYPVEKARGNAKKYDEF